MSTLRNAEGAISGFFDRIFGRMFRGYVEPVELARKLAREMEDHKTVSVSRVYVPNEYVIYLSERDHGRFRSFESSLTAELAAYLAERARHEGFTLLSDPIVRIELDRDLTVGAYGIACRVVDLPPDGAEPAPLVAQELDEPSAPATTVRPAPGTDPFSPFIAATPPPPAVPLPPLDAEPAAEEDEGAPAEPAATDPEPAAAAAPEAVDDAIAAHAEPEPVPVAEPEPVVEPEPVAAAPHALEPDPEHAVWPQPPILPGAPDPVPAARLGAAPPVPPPPAPARPLPPPGDYEPLAGVSGTQIFEPAHQVEPILQEEMSLIIDGRRVRITRRTTAVGRSRDCEIPIADPNASRRHAEIRHIGLDYFLVDLNSTNGTYVNGQRVRRHALASGDRITIGTTEMLVEHVTVERG